MIAAAGVFAFSRTVLCALIGAALLPASAAWAQSADAPASRVEVGFGLLWVGAQPLGSNSATETTGAGGTLTLFNASSDLAGAAGFAGRIGVRITRALVAEADASFLEPQLRVALSGDAESAPPITAVEPVQQFTIGGNLLWYVPGGRWPRVAPFALAGGGYLRQLHDNATLAATGRFYQFGGGVKALLVTGRHFHTKGIGVRADVRALIRSKGVAFDGGSKTSAAAGVSAFVRF